MTNHNGDGRSARTALLVRALGNLPADELKRALARAPTPTASVPARNAWNALRRDRDPAAVFSGPQYRAALPYVAASLSEEPLAQTVDALGEHSENPTREQLVGALDQARSSFSDATLAVMLASVAYDELPSSDLCAELLGDDPRFGLVDPNDDPNDEPEDHSGVEGQTPPEADSSGGAPKSPGTSPGPEDDDPKAGPPGASPEQRAARRARREQEKAERRRKAEVAARADHQVRQRRKQERTHPGGR